MYKKKIIPIRSMAASFCQIQKYQESEREVHIFARSVCRTAACPRCDHISSHLHATYQRIIQTLPVHGKYTCLHVTAYKYNCVNSTCSQKVFMESLPESASAMIRCGESPLPFSAACPPPCRTAGAAVAFLLRSADGENSWPNSCRTGKKSVSAGPARRAITENASATFCRLPCCTPGISARSGIFWNR